MGIFGSPNVEKMVEKGDINGLIKTLEYKTNNFDRKDADIRIAAAKALGEMRNPVAIDGLIMMLGHPYELDRYRASQVLLLFGDSTREPLQIALRTGADPIREEAAALLGQVGNESVVLPLIAALKDPNGNVHKNAVKSLGMLSDERAVEPIISIMVNKDYFAHDEAVKALGKFKDSRAVEPLLAELKESYPGSEIKPAVITALGQQSDSRAVPALIAELKNPKNDLKVKKATLEALSKIQDPAVFDLFLNQLIEKQQNVSRTSQQMVHGAPDNDTVSPRSDDMAEEWQTCLFAARALGNYGDERAVDILIKVIQDKDHWWELRKEAAEALGKLGASRAAMALSAVLEQSTIMLKTPRKREHDQVRTAAAEALEKIQANTANQEIVFETLLEGQRSENREIHNTSSSTLWKMGEKAVEPLLRKLSDPDPMMRSGVSSILGSIRDQRATQPLLELLKTEENKEVQSTVLNALGRIGDNRAVEFMIDLVKNGLQDPHKPDYMAVQDAVYVLGQIGDPRAVEPILSMMHLGDQQVKTAMVQALGKLGDERAVEPILAEFMRSHDKDSRINAARALFALCDPRAVEPLVTDFRLRTDNWEYRKELAEGLVKMYHSGRLDDFHKSLILAVRPLIIEEHKRKIIEVRHDDYGDRGQISDPSSSRLEETGVGVDFPL